VTPGELGEAANAALEDAHELPARERLQAADQLAELALSLRGAAAQLRRDALVGLVAEEGYERTAALAGVTVRAVRRHVPAGQEHRPILPAAKRKRAAELYARGMSYRQIEAKLRMGHHEVRQGIMEAGVPIRGPRV
jgi:hypothetical protein